MSLPNLSTMTLVKAFRLSLYILLCIGALAFVMGTIDDYLEGKAYYSTTNEPVTLQDLPSLTICWPLNDYLGVYHYATNFTIDVKVSETQENTPSISLELNKSIKTDSGIVMKLSKVWSKSTPSLKCFETIRDVQCFKITLKYDGPDNNVDFEKFQVLLAFKPSNKDFIFKDQYVRILATSEENSYGLAGGRWFDGNVYCSSLRTGYQMKIQD